MHATYVRTPVKGMLPGAKRRLRRLDNKRLRRDARHVVNEAMASVYDPADDCPQCGALDSVCDCFLVLLLDDINALLDELDDFGDDW